MPFGASAMPSIAADLEAAMAETRADVVFEPQRAATEGAYLGREGLRRWLAD